MYAYVFNAMALASAEASSWGGRGDDGWWWPAPIVFPLLWIATFALLVWLFRRSRQPHDATGIERARAVLAERYARGEVDTEEYSQRREKLDS